MTKNNIRILIQTIQETAEQFAERVELKVNNLSDEFSYKIVDNATILFSSSSDGRQTANIQFFTKEKNSETKEALFDRKKLTDAYINFKENNLFETPFADKLFDFLLKQKNEDYI